MTFNVRLKLDKTIDDFYLIRFQQDVIECIFKLKEIDRLPSFY